MGSPCPPHLLLLHGELSLSRGGITAICCHLMEHMSKKKVSITLLGETVVDQLDEETKNWMEENDINYIEPDDDAEERPKDCVHALHQHETYFPELPEDITHVLVVNPHAIVTLAPNGLVQKLKSSPKVTVLNHMSHLQLVEWNSFYCDEVLEENDVLGWTNNPQVSLVLSVGLGNHGLWSNQLDRTKKLLHLERSHHLMAPLSTLDFTKQDRNTTSVYEIHTLSGCIQFLKRISEHLKTVALTLNNIKPCRFVWTVFRFGRLRTEDETALQNVLSGKIELKMCKLESLAALQSSLETSSLVLQDGTYDILDRYCGLESLLCGVPTLVPFDSHVADLLQSINKLRAGYFTLPPNDRSWSSKIIEVLNNDSAVHEAVEFARLIKEHQCYTGCLNEMEKWLGIYDGNQSASNVHAKQEMPALVKPPSAMLRRGDFQIDDKQPLGKGGFGEVFLGKYKGKAVAVKKIKIREFKREFQEIDIVKMLNHVNIVEIHGVCIDSDTVFLLMEKLHCSMLGKISEDLKQKDANLKLTEEQKVSVATGCAAGLDYVHSLHVVHQDIKPENILLNRDLVPKLCDFGLARIKASTTGVTSTTSNNCGTALYAAPETFETGRRPQPYSDIWSMLCTLVQWFNPKGRVWFPEPKSFHEMHNKLYHKTIPIGLKKVQPEWVKRIIERSLKYDIKERPTAKALLEYFNKKHVTCVGADQHGRVSNGQQAEDVLNPSAMPSNRRARDHGSGETPHGREERQKAPHGREEKQQASHGREEKQQAPHGREEKQQAPHGREEKQQAPHGREERQQAYQPDRTDSNVSTPLKQVYEERCDSGVESLHSHGSSTPLKQVCRADPEPEDEEDEEASASDVFTNENFQNQLSHQSSRTQRHGLTTGSSIQHPFNSRSSRLGPRSFSSPMPSSHSSGFSALKKSKNKSDSDSTNYTQKGKGGTVITHRGLPTSVFDKEFQSFSGK